MKITEVKTLLTCPGRNYCIVKIVTDEGIVGYGDATLNGRELAVKSALDNHIANFLIGSDSDRITDLWELLFRGTYWRGGPVLMTALAGIDMALWDIKGKRYNAPLYSLLGGKSRDKIRAYFHVHGHTKEHLLERIRLRMEDGCRCVRYSFDTGDPLEGHIFVQPHQDIGSGSRIEVSKEAINRPGVWDTEVYQKDLIRVTEYLRENLGDSVALIHDSHERFTPIQAAAAARELEPFHLLYLEDPIEPTRPQSLEVIRSHSTTPLAMGELYHTMKDCLPPIEKQWIDYIRVDISHFGGITPLMKLSAFADCYAVKTAFHGPSDISPLAHAALAHVDLTIPNFGIQEYIDQTKKVEEVFHTGITYRGGYLEVSDKPGLGVEVDEEAAAKFDYDPKYLPVLRDREGAVHNW